MDPNVTGLLLNYTLGMNYEVIECLMTAKRMLVDMYLGLFTIILVIDGAAFILSILDARGFLRREKGSWFDFIVNNASHFALMVTLMVTLAMMLMTFGF